MAHGQPDFGMYAIASTIHRLADMGELAVRLGSISTHDRRGSVILYDDFESGVQAWRASGTGTGNAVAPNGQYARSGGFSCKLTTGAAANALCNITRFLPYPDLSKLGFELAFTMRQNIEVYRMLIQVYKGATVHEAAVRYVLGDSPPNDDTLQIYDNLSWVDLATGLYAFPYEGYDFHVMKLVADFENDVYTRLIFDDTEYDLSDYIVGSSASVTGRHMRVFFEVVNDALEVSRNCYVDDAIVTQQEP